MFTNIRIVLSALIITGAIAAIGSGATGAFFSDTETSTNNTFVAGAFDLKIDNDSYYNGNRCVNTQPEENDPDVWLWQGPNPYPVPGTPCTTSWVLDDLANGHLFFNFLDLKPDDDGEDTISLHVENDAWACMELSLVEDDDNSTTEPEGIVDPAVADPANDNWDGELADNLEFYWWADDGDNVLEEDEAGSIMEAPVSLYALAGPTPFRVALADASTNVWDGIESLPNGTHPAIPGGTTRYIAKAWCFGDMALAPDDQDGPNSNGPQQRNGNGGYTCNGTTLGNATQTDSSIVNVQFISEQARHNGRFLCPSSIVTTLTLQKIVINDDVGTATDANFVLSANGPSNISGVEGSVGVTNAPVIPGAYTLSETQMVGYTASQYSCVVNGGLPVVGNQITINPGDTVVCTITNNDVDTIACTAEVSYADAVVTSDQGVRKNNTAINVDRTDPLDALGAPQSTGTPFDNPVVAGSFFSLGFDEGTDLTPNEGGWIVLSFNNNYIIDGPGNDIRAWEVTGGTSYPVEKLKVEVSQDGTTWYTANPSLLRDEEADMSNTPLDWARYVRLTDVSTRSEFEATADGYDLDAVSALNCAQLPPQAP